MSYEPTTWGVGDVITAQKMNNIEAGIQEAAQSGGGFDAEINIYHPQGSADYECTILSGTFASLYAMLEDGKMPLILARVNDLSINLWAATTSVVFYGWNGEFLTMFVKAPKAIGNGTYSSEWHTYSYLIWNNQDELYFD